MNSAQNSPAKGIGSQPRSSAPSRMVILIANSKGGCGKTTIATRYARDVHRRVLRRDGPLTVEGHQRWPVAFIPLSAGVTLKGLNQQILRFYGHPAVDPHVQGPR